MLSIFTIPKPFSGLFRTIQTNAIKSWLEVTPNIFLFGNEVGIKETARNFHLTHIPNIAKNKNGTPLIFDVVAKMYERSRGSVFAYVNCDIIIMEKINSIIKNITLPKYLVVGQRWPLYIKKQIVGSFNWRKKIASMLAAQRSKPITGGSDYFIYPRSINFSMPPFSIGRYWWDSWFIYFAKSVGIPIINSTQSITAVHQQHYLIPGMHADQNLYLGDEARENLNLLGGKKFSFTIFDADYLLTRKGLKKQPMTLARRIRETELTCIMRSKSLIHYRFFVLLFNIGRKLFIKAGSCLETIVNSFIRASNNPD